MALLPQPSPSSFKALSNHHPFETWRRSYFSCRSSAESLSAAVQRSVSLCPATVYKCGPRPGFTFPVFSFSFDMIKWVSARRREVRGGERTKATEDTERRREGGEEGGERTDGDKWRERRGEEGMREDRGEERRKETRWKEIRREEKREASKGERSR